MKKAIIAGLVVLGALLAPAATVVDMNLNLSGSVSPTRTIDVNTTSNQTYNWSSSSLLFDGPVTAGNQNLKIYGAFSATGIAGALSSATVRLDDSAVDAILFRGDVLPANAADLRAVALWDAADFLASGNTRFDTSTNSSLTIGVDSWLNVRIISGTRYVIRDGTNYYVSSVKGPIAQTTSATIYGNTAGLLWAAFDINNWATYSETDANLGLGTLSFSAKVFNNVTGVGLLGSATRSGGSPPIFEVADFQASLVAPLTNIFTLTVNNGSGGGLYTNGAQIAIAAYSTPYQTFVRWTGNTQYVANVNSSNTTVTMPATNIALDVTFSYFTPSNWPDIYAPLYNEQGTNYAPYPLVANDSIDKTFSTSDLIALARNFDCMYSVKGNFTKANADYIYGLNPHFQIVGYINESHHWSPAQIEPSNKTNTLYYLAGNLGMALPATTNSATFAVKNLFGTLLASTAAAGANVTYKVGSIYYFVTWLKIDGELMRIESVANNSNVATVTVTRAFSGTTAAAHSSNTPVLAPAYFQPGLSVGMTNEFEFYGDPAAPLMAQDRMDFAIRQYTNENQGVWEDICGSTLNCGSMDGQSITLDDNRFWDLRKNQIYTASDFSAYTEEGINYNQTNFFAMFGKQLVFWANNIGSPTDFANNPRVGMLQSTPYKPRPIDGFSQESSIGALMTATDFQPNSYSKWGDRVQATMFLGENKLAAMYSMLGAGSDNVLFSAASAAMRHDLFLYGYASYLLAVKVETNDLIYTKFGMNPLVGASSASAYYELDPMFLYPIGRPTETRASTDYTGYLLPGRTTFMRQFENGLILTNPGDNTNVTDVVALSRPYFDPEVGLTVTQVLMRAKSGRILLNPSSVSLTVNNGSGGGSYTNRQQVVIAADAPAFQKVFDRWTGDTNYVANVYAPTTTVTMGVQNISLTATYKDITYVLTVNNGFGGGSYTNGRQVAISAGYLTGKAFYRWTGDTQYVNNVTYTNAIVTMSTNAVTLTATYVDVYYALTVNNGTGGGGTYTNGTQVAISASNLIGKAFVQWTGNTAYVANSNSAITTVTMPASAVTLTAAYVDLYYALTVTGGSGSGSYTNARQVAISANAPTIGKAFSQWVGDTQYVASASSANTTVTMPAQAISLTATYVDVYYALTVNSGSGGGSYTNGRQVAISANAPAVGKAFSQWIGDTQYVNNVTYTNAMVTMSTNAVSLTATYVDVLYTLTVNSGTGGGSYTNAQVVAISATAPAPGTTFDKWTGSTQYVNNVTYTNALVTMPAQDMALTATYKNLPGYYTLTVSNGTGSGAYTNGTQVAITAVAPDGTAFGQWTGDTQVVAGVFSFNTTVTMPAQNTALSASCVDVSNGVASVTWASGIIYYEPDFASLLGPTGSGKSTIAQLMYSPDDIKDGILPGGAGAVNDVVWDTITLTENGDGVIEWGIFSTNTVRAGTNGYVYALIFQDNNVQPGTLYVAGPLVALVDGLGDVNTCVDPGNGDAINGVNSAPVIGGGNVSYTLTVNSGTSSGSYTNGQQVAIAASNAPSGKGFDKWTGDTQYVASVSSASTTVTMPSQAVALTATYADIYYLLTANGATGGSISPASTNVIFGGSAGFVVTASNYYRIAGMFTNGVPVTGMSFDNNSTTTNFIWSNVQTSGVLAATFAAQVTTNGPAQVPYSWLAQYGLTNYNTDAATDQDQDGLTTWQEYIAGTVPTNGASCFKAAQNTRNVISWSTVSGRVYSVYWSTNLVKGFQALETNILYPRGSYTNATPDSRLNHYQLKVRLQ